MFYIRTGLNENYETANNASDAYKSALSMLGLFDAREATLSLAKFEEELGKIEANRDIEIEDDGFFDEKWSVAIESVAGQNSSYTETVFVVPEWAWNKLSH